MQVFQKRCHCEPVRRLAHPRVASLAPHPTLFLACHCEPVRRLVWQSVPLPAGQFTFWQSVSPSHRPILQERSEICFVPDADFRVGAKHLRCTLFAQTQAPAQPLRSLGSSGLPLRFCAARCLRKTKWLPNFFAPLPPPLAAVARRPLAALPCGPRRFAPRNDSAGRNPVIKIRVLTKTDRQNLFFGPS